MILPACQLQAVSSHEQFWNSKLIWVYVILKKKKNAAGWSRTVNVTDHIFSSFTDSDKIGVWRINIRSLRNRFSYLSGRIWSRRCHGVVHKYITLRLSNWIFNTRHHRIGDVVFYVKTNLHAHLLPTLCITNIHATSIRLNDKLRKWIFGLIFRPPAQSCDTDEKIYDQFVEICCQNDSEIIVDFNLPVTKWDEPLTRHSGQDLYTNLQESGIHQHTEHPIIGINILDIILTTADSQVNNVKICPELRLLATIAVYYWLLILARQRNAKAETEYQIIAVLILRNL